VGTLSRRVPGNDHRLTHLVCWRLDEVGQKMLTAARLSSKDDRELATAVAGWLTEASTTWIPAWLTGKRVLILGCGALGGKLHDAAAGGHLKGFVHAYLGMPDERVPVPVADLDEVHLVRAVQCEG